MDVGLDQQFRCPTTVVLPSQLVYVGIKINSQYSSLKPCVYPLLHSQWSTVILRVTKHHHTAPSALAALHTGLLKQHVIHALSKLLHHRLHSTVRASTSSATSWTQRSEPFADKLKYIICRDLFDTRQIQGALASLVAFRPRAQVSVHGSSHLFNQRWKSLACDT